MIEIDNGAHAPGLRPVSRAGSFSLSVAPRRGKLAWRGVFCQRIMEAPIITHLGEVILGRAGRKRRNEH